MLYAGKRPQGQAKHPCGALEQTFYYAMQSGGRDIKVKRIEDMVLAVLFLLFFGAVLLGIDRWIGSFRPTQVFETGPKIFPVFLAKTALVLLSCVLISQILKFRGAYRRDDKKEDEETVTPMLKQYVLFAALLSLIIFIYAMEYVGFFISSLFLLFALQYILGNTSLYKIALFSLGIITANFFIFIKLLQIQMPRGLGIFEKFSQLFY